MVDYLSLGLMNHLKEHIAFWEFIDQCLVQNLPCMLLLVVDHQGSSPGRTGFKMGINAAGEMMGSIGGGVMEHKLVELSKKWLAEGKQVIELKRQVHKAEVGKDRSGMICSGEQQVAMISLDKHTKGLVTSIITALQNQSSQYLSLSNQGLQLTNAAAGVGLQYVSEVEWTYEEELGGVCSLHIVGGGHISLALSKLGSELGFR